MISAFERLWSCTKRREEKELGVGGGMVIFLFPSFSHYYRSLLLSLSTSGKVRQGKVVEV